MDKMFLWVILITLIIGVGGTGIGGLSSFIIKKNSSKTVSLLLSFAGGVMIAVVCFDLLIEALAVNGAGSSPRLPIVLICVAIGYAIVGLFNYLIDMHTNPKLGKIYPDHPDTADDLDELIHSDYLKKKYNESSNSLFGAGLIMATAIALHNLPEGMVIGAAYTRDNVSSVWSGSGFLMTILIGLHNIPEGMAISVPLVAGGMSKGKAMIITAASGLPIVIGAMLGYWLGTMGDFMQTMALSFASGAMLYVVFGELLPEAILMWRSKLPSVAVMIGIAVGMIVIFL